MIHISLFSGIGGFELAAEWMGWRNWVSCDINEFGNKVREYYWPDGYCHKDVKTLTYETINKELSDRFGSGWRDDDIILTGGFPCQPYSSAGKRLGKEDERHLWPEMLRVISEVKPTYIVGENVRGLTNWNGGVVFEEVCADLENLGYEVQPVLLPACAVNAPHRRDRIWFVAYSNNNRYKTNKRKISKEDRIQGINRKEMGSRKFNGANISWNATNPYSDGLHQCDSEHEIDSGQGGQHALGDLEPSHGDGDAADTSSIRCKSTRKNRKIYKTSKISCGKRSKSSISIKNDDANGDAADTKGIGRKDALEDGKLERGRFGIGNKPPTWNSFPTQSPVCGGDDGLPTRLDNITFSKWRNESIKAYGNAIVPQVAYQIFKALCQSTSNCETFNSDSLTTDSNQTSPKPTNSGWNSSNDQ